MQNPISLYNVVVIGAGAAGLMCAIEAGKRGRNVLVIDHAANPAEKIRISGGGRCNFTNLDTTPKNFLSQNPHFCVSALSRYTPQHFIALVKKHNIAYHEKTLGQLFCDHSSRQIIDMLLAECAAANVKIQLGKPISAIKKTETGFSIMTDAQEISCQSLVVACGGKSIPKMGATGFGYEIAQQFGLNIIEPRAALVPLTFQNEMLKYVQSLSGIAVDVQASCNGAQFKEALLFTHRGLSGPAILQISSYWKEGDEVAINFAPSQNIFTLLKQEKEQHPRQEMATILSRFLPKRLAQRISPDHEKIAELPDARLAELAEAIQNWRIKPDGTEGFRTAEVTLGGVDTNMLSSKTFEAKLVPGLFFIGEVVDVTGHLGGFNFQWAWASGHAAGQYV